MLNYFTCFVMPLCRVIFPRNLQTGLLDMCIKPGEIEITKIVMWDCYF